MPPLRARAPLAKRHRLGRYEIAKGYYDAAPDKRAAVRELLLATDFEEVLRRRAVGGK